MPTHRAKPGPITNRFCVCHLSLPALPPPVPNFVTDIYDPGFVESLFDEMASTYDAVNYVASIGFSKRWRRQVVSKAMIQPGMVVCDLMCGMGECWNAIALGLEERDELVGSE